MKILFMFLLFLLVCVTGITGLVRYRDSFEHARWIGDWKRVPLEYPYHLVDYGEDAGVTLEDWRVYTGEIERERSDVNVDSLSLEEESLLTLKCIVQFAHEKGFLLGVRNLHLAMPGGALSDPRWFILRFGESKPWYAESKADFEKKCRTLGLEAKKFQTFESAWLRK